MTCGVSALSVCLPSACSLWHEFCLHSSTRNCVSQFLSEHLQLASSVCHKQTFLLFLWVILWETKPKHCIWKVNYTLFLCLTFLLYLQHGCVIIVIITINLIGVRALQHNQCNTRTHSISDKVMSTACQQRLISLWIIATLLGDHSKWVIGSYNKRVIDGQHDSLPTYTF